MKNLAESSNKGCGSKMAAVPMMMMLISGQVGMQESIKYSHYFHFLPYFMSSCFYSLTMCYNNLKKSM
jgi:hypothetical protein